MESLCGPVLYERREHGITITTRSCSQVLYEIGPCDASYLYLNEQFYYTIACPIADVSKNTTKNATKNAQNATKNLQNAQNTKNTEQANSTVSATNKSHLLRGGQTNRTGNETIPLNSSVYRYPIEGKVAMRTETLGPALLIVLIVSAVLLSVLSCAVFLLKRKSAQKKSGRLRKRPSSSIMPQVVRRTGSEEVRQVLNKMVNTICRWNGQRPYRHSAPESAPPIPPRPPAATKRSETLQYLRRTNPHAAIQKALGKPPESFADAGQRRAELLRREAALLTRKKKRRGGSRMKRIVRLREIQAKNDQKNIG